MINKEQFAQEWEEKISKEELFSKIEENKKQEGELHPNLTPEQIEQRALIKTRLELKRLSAIPSTQFRGFILGTSEIVNMGAIRKKLALEKYSENPEKAIRENLVIEDGDKVIPIDNRQFFDKAEKFKNPNYKKPLPEINLFKTIYGIAKKNGEIEYTYFVMGLNNEKAKLDFKLFKPLKWRGKDNTKENNYFKITSNAATIEFEVDRSVDETKINFRELLIKTFGEDNAIELNDIPSWYKKNKDNRDALFAAEGYIVSLSSTPSLKGNYSLILDDESLGTQEVINSFIKGETYEKCNLSTNAKILIVGKPIEIEDKETHEKSLLLNILGIYTYPEYITPTPKKIEEDVLSPKEEKSDEEFT